MPLPVLQCMNCKFGSTLKWDIEEDKYKCSEFSEQVPIYVEEATKDCPKFEEKE